MVPLSEIGGAAPAPGSGPVRAPGHLTQYANRRLVYACTSRRSKNRCCKRGSPGQPNICDSAAVRPAVRQQGVLISED